MKILFYSLRYLTLRTERNRLLCLRDIIPTSVLALVISLPFILAKDAIYFGPQGLLDRAGTLASALTGFFIAALVAVATFSDKIGDLDGPIRLGKIFYASEDILSKNSLSRREYVCTIFGYLSFISLIVSLISILIVTLYPSIIKYNKCLFEEKSNAHYILTYMSYFIMLVVSTAISHTVITTCHGLYYMIDRIYTKESQIMPKNRTPPRLDQ